MNPSMPPMETELERLLEEWDRAVQAGDRAAIDRLSRELEHLLERLRRWERERDGRGGE
jgi:hypothetical protein